MNSEIDQERTGCTESDLQPQGRQAIERLAELKRFVGQPVPDLSDSREYLFAATLLLGALLNLFETPGDQPGTMNLETSPVVREPRHLQAFLGLESLWIFFISAMTFFKGIPSSTTVYFCRSAALN